MLHLNRDVVFVALVASAFYVSTNWLIVLRSFAREHKVLKLVTF